MLLIAIVFGPIGIAVSIIVDLLSLPNTLLKESKGFEHKYQLSSDRLNDAQITVVMETFGKIFYGQNFQGYKGQHMTLIQLMMMHRKIFSIVDNLHDLTCRGNKDYKQALSNVQDYNMTKILTRKCAIPDKNGDYKEGRCDLDVIYSVQMDIELLIKSYTNQQNQICDDTIFENMTYPESGINLGLTLHGKEEITAAHTQSRIIKNCNCFVPNKPIHSNTTPLVSNCLYPISNGTLNVSRKGLNEMATFLKHFVKVLLKCHFPQILVRIIFHVLKFYSLI